MEGLMPEAQSHRVLSRHELREQFGIKYSRQYLYVLEPRGEIPKQIRLSRRRVVWDEAQEAAWLAQRSAARQPA